MTEVVVSRISPSRQRWEKICPDVRSQMCSVAARATFGLAPPNGAHPRGSYTLFHNPILGFSATMASTCRLVKRAQSCTAPDTVVCCLSPYPLDFSQKRTQVLSLWSRTIALVMKHEWQSQPTLTSRNASGGSPISLLTPRCKSVNLAKARESQAEPQGALSPTFRRTCRLDSHH